jgi:hypothetical protein
MFFVPWWLFLWMSGRRYSLRRVIGNTLCAGVLAEVAGTGWFWAGRSAPQPYLAALRYAGMAAALAAAYTSLEPFFALVVESFRARRLRTGILRQTGWGFTVWWAFIIAALCWWQSPKLPYLHVWLEQLRAAQALTADAKFLVAVTLAVLPLVLLLRAALIAVDGAEIGGAEAAAPRFTRAPDSSKIPIRPGAVPPRWEPGPARRPYGPAPQPPRPPRPARIISVEIGQPKERDGK